MRLSASTHMSTEKDLLMELKGTAKLYNRAILRKRKEVGFYLSRHWRRSVLVSASIMFMLSLKLNFYLGFLTVSVILASHSCAYWL